MTHELPRATPPRRRALSRLGSRQPVRPICAMTMPRWGMLSSPSLNVLVSGISALAHTDDRRAPPWGMWAMTSWPSRGYTIWFTSFSISSSSSHALRDGCQRSVVPPPPLSWLPLARALLSPPRGVRGEINRGEPKGEPKGGVPPRALRGVRPPALPARGVLAPLAARGVLAALSPPVLRGV